MKGAAIDHQEGMVGPGARLVNCPCDEPLSRSGLSQDEDRGIGGCHPLYHLEQRPHRLALSQNDCGGVTLTDDAPKRDVFFLELPFLCRPPQDGLDL